MINSTETWAVVKRVSQDYVSPAIATGMVTYSFKRRQPFAIQLVASWMAQSIIRESNSDVWRALLSSKMCMDYLNRFVILIKVLNMYRPGLSFNRTLDVCGNAYLGSRWLYEVVMLHPSFARRRQEVLTALGLGWVLLSMYVSIKY